MSGIKIVECGSGYREKHLIYFTIY